MSLPTLGALAPDFVLDDLSGQAHSLREELAHGPTALFFFKLDCATTRLAVPFVVRLSRGYREHRSPEDTALGVLGISQDDADSTRRFGEEMGIDFPVLIDRELEVSRAYELQSTPTLILLRGADRLRAVAGQSAITDPFRVADVIEGWSREAYTMLSEEIAARIAALPVELFDEGDEVPRHRPG